MDKITLYSKDYLQKIAGVNLISLEITFQTFEQLQFVNFFIRVPGTKVKFHNRLNLNRPA